MNRFALIVPALLVGSASVAHAQELLINPGFEDTDGNGSQGDGWGSFGNAGFNAFFGANGHASLFSADPGNSGGVFQTGIAAVSGDTYTFTLTDVFIEANAQANFEFGLEFFAADDSSLLADTFTTFSGSTPEGGFAVSAIAVADAAFVRPVIRFDNVTGTNTSQANAFVFDASLTAVPEPASLALLGAGGLALLGRRRLR